MSNSGIDVEFIECSLIVEISEEGIETNVESKEFLNDCSQSIKSELSFAQQDNSSENCIILKQKEGSMANSSSALHHN